MRVFSIYVYIWLIFSLLFFSHSPVRVYDPIKYSSILVHFFIGLFLWVKKDTVDSFLKGLHRNTFLGFIILYSIFSTLFIYPKLNTHDGYHGSDGDDALDMVCESLIAGEYTHQHTYLGNPVNIMPGIALTALPFYAVTKHSAFQNIFFLGVFVFLFLKRFHSPANLLLFLWVTPLLHYKLWIGSDHITQAILLVLFIELTWKAKESNTFFFWGLSLFCATLLLLSRVNYIPVLLFSLVFLFRGISIKQALLYGTSLILACIALGLFFYVFTHYQYDYLFGLHKHQGSLPYFIGACMFCLLLGLYPFKSDKKTLYLTVSILIGLSLLFITIKEHNPYSLFNYALFYQIPLIYSGLFQTVSTKESLS